MPIIPFPEWQPDQPDFGPPGATVILNCTPLTAKSYGPMPTPAIYSTNTLAGRCQGSYSIKDAQGAVHIFAADGAHLYHMAPSFQTFADVSRTTGGAYTTPSAGSGAFWDMTSYGKRIIATNYTDPIQTMLLGDTNFTPLSATAPQARFVATVKDFLMVGNTQDGVSGQVPYRVWWSALGDPTQWPTPGSVTALQLQSDYQDLQQTDLGPITGLEPAFLGAADVAIFCERGLWTANFVGPPTIFAFRVVAGAPGTLSPLSIVSSRMRGTSGILHVTYYLGEDGFQAFDGSAANPIGAQKFDREFYRELNGTYLNYVQGAADPGSKLIFWAFASTYSTDGLFDRVLVYNWELSRAVLCEMELTQNHSEWLTRSLYGTAYNLEQLDQFGNVDTIMPSLDDPFWLGNTKAYLSTFCVDHALYTWNGLPMGPTIDTVEIQPSPERRSWVINTRPLIDGGDPVATVQIGHRERLSQPVTWEAAVPINIVGDCPQRCTGRYIRFRFSMPRGQTFTHLQGIKIEVAAEGTMR